MINLKHLNEPEPVCFYTLDQPLVTELYREGKAVQAELQQLKEFNEKLLRISVLSCVSAELSPTAAGRVKFIEIANEGADLLARLNAHPLYKQACEKAREDYGLSSSQS